MSETVQYRGKLKKVAEIDILSDESPESQLNKDAKLILDPYDNFCLPDDFENWMDMLRDTDEFILHDNVIYKILHKKQIDINDDLFEAARVEDVIIFDVKYYNGGCSFQEAVMTALDDLGELSE